MILSCLTEKLTAVHEYWKTLEYCYAVADPRAASHAFPGSAVHEVFHYWSWASVRVVTADQRTELLKRIMKNNVHEKVPFKECEKIAQDLNLTLEQKIKKSLEERSVKRPRVDAVTRQFCGLTGAAIEFVEEQNPSTAYSGELDFHKDDHLETVEEPELNEEDECHSLLSQLAFSKMRPSRQKRFSWTDEADRKLVIQYVRYRAALGAKFHRVDGASLPKLPASSGACMKRMSSLKRNSKFRKAVMKLCNLLSERYAKHLKKNPEHANVQHQLQSASAQLVQ